MHSEHCIFSHQSNTAFTLSFVFDLKSFSE